MSSYLSGAMSSSISLLLVSHKQVLSVDPFHFLLAQHSTIRSLSLFSSKVSKPTLLILSIFICLVSSAWHHSHSCSLDSLYLNVSLYM